MQVIPFDTIRTPALSTQTFASFNQPVPQTLIQDIFSPRFGMTALAKDKREEVVSNVKALLETAKGQQGNKLVHIKISLDAWAQKGQNNKMLSLSSKLRDFFLDTRNSDLIAPIMTLLEPGMNEAFKAATRSKDPIGKLECMVEYLVSPAVIERTVKDLWRKESYRTDIVAALVDLSTDSVPSRRQIANRLLTAGDNRASIKKALEEISETQGHLFQGDAKRLLRQLFS